jgi:VanZ family protein
VKQRRRLKLRVNRLVCFISWIAVVAWGVTIFWLSSLSGDQLEKLHFNAYDKAAHFAAFAVGSMLLVNAFILTTRWQRGQILFFAIVCIALFGASDEWHQLSTPNRSGADLYDWIADLFGAAFGAFAALFIHVRYLAKSCRVAAGDRGA